MTMEDDLPKYPSNKELIESLKLHRFYRRRVSLKAGLITSKGANLLVSTHTT